MLWRKGDARKGMAVMLLLGGAGIVVEPQIINLLPTTICSGAGQSIHMDPLLAWLNFGIRTS